LVLAELVLTQLEAVLAAIQSLAQLHQQAAALVVIKAVVKTTALAVVLAAVVLDKVHQVVLQVHQVKVTAAAVRHLAQLAVVVEAVQILLVLLGQQLILLVMAVVDSFQVLQERQWVELAAVEAVRMSQAQRVLERKVVDRVI
jgi:hypothetical protein